MNNACKAVTINIRGLFLIYLGKVNVVQVFSDRDFWLISIHDPGLTEGMMFCSVGLFFSALLKSVLHLFNLFSLKMKSEASFQEF